MKIRKTLYYCFTIILGLFLTGCATTSQNEEVYIPKQDYKKAETCDTDYGLNQGWLNTENIRYYDKVKVNVFINSKQYPESWWDRQNVRNLVATKKEDEHYVSEYTKDSLEKAISKESGLKVTDQSGPRTLEIDYAIVQVVPNKPIIGSVTNILGLTLIGLLLTPVKVIAKSQAESNGGAIAMETMIKDSNTGEVEGIFADREKGKTAILINFNEFRAYSNVRVIVDQWNDQISKILKDAKTGKKFNPTAQHQFVFVDY